MSTALIIALTIVVLFAAYMIYSFRRMKTMAAVTESEKIITLTDKNFRNQIKNGLVMVDFWAEWCMPCKVMGPVLNELAEDANFKAAVAKLNVDHYQSVSQQFGIRGIPTIILFKNGKEVDRIVGIKPKDFLIKQVNKHL
ncbi:thioredoxin [Lentimicrobium sp.]|jgi:thioredoxin 1|uniref:thioredoxin n=1 Tax=Lentimicrobium sp. TaxID=2034841 RepID=UPI0025FCC239|nr:thioredoxin [Lentimicrobium sp.]MCO5257874.1 thioredoxin [Lentimicrobium sp.]MCO5263223.1 thioredoxin [Lentimicrobium sp.]HOP12854.1 thioredoxin [Lentimicrobium sp.]HPF64097.1 thioredoxin [Lentimicrobium sp.]HPJ62847.1 thioredoxin [Lentimicrobium sp.]